MLDCFGLLSVISASASFVLNIALLPIIALKSGKNIGSYKVLLFLNTSVAAYYAANHALLIPAFYVEDGAYIFFATNPHLPVTMGHICIATFSIGFVFIVICLSISFVYRLSVMTGSPDAAWFRSPCRLFAIASVSILLCTVAGNAIVFGFMPCEKNTLALAHSFHAQTGYQLSEVGYHGGFVYDRETGVVTDGVLTCMLVVGGLSVVAIVTMTYCTIRIIHFFRTHMNKQQGKSTAMQYHKKLFTLLLLQASFPFVFTLSPVILCFSLGMMNVSTGSLPMHLGSVMAIATVVEPLLVVYFVKDYRQAISKMIRRGPHGERASSITGGMRVAPAHTQPTTRASSRIGHF